MANIVKQIDRENQDILSNEIIRSEVNFLLFPFFALWDKDVKERTETLYKTIVQRNDKRLEVEWNVLAHQRFGYPGPLAKKIHKAIEEKISQLALPIENPICIGALYKLAKKVGLSVGGRAYEQIKEALKTIVTTTIVSKGAFYSKDEKKYIDDTFHLYERVIFKGEKLRSGEIAEDNYIYLGSWYLDNINARYVKPIDYNYYMSLGHPIAARLYEMLSVKFYGLLEAKGKFLRYRYSTLCDFLPAKKRKYLSWAKQSFNPSHDKLVDTGFLSDYNWEKIKGEKRDWYIYYFPGNRVKEEIEMFRDFEQQSEEELTPPQSEGDDGKETSEISNDLVYELKKRRISKYIAEKLVKYFDADYIKKKIEMFDYLRNKGKDFDNPAGWLKSAIEEDYEIDDFEEKYDKKKLSEKAKKLREQRIEEALVNFPDRNAWIQKRVDKAKRDRNEMAKNMRSKHPYTEKEIEQLRKEYSESYPQTEEEKRNWLERQPEYRTSSIVEELRSGSR